MPAKSIKIIVKSNKLIEASYRLGLIEQRIILAAIVEARETQTGLGDGFITLDASRFAQTFGMTGGAVYDQIKDAMKTLFHRFITVRDIDTDDNCERISTIRWISTASYLDGVGKIKIRFATDMVPYITRLGEEFTSYRLDKIGGMTSAHAVRMYELLVQYLNIGMREIEIAWLKKTLALGDEYQRIDHFKSRVIDVGVKQINEHSDIRVQYTQRKTGRIVTHLIFEIKPEPKAKTEKPVKASKRIVINDAYIEKHARPGETWKQAYMRLAEENGQAWLVD